MAKIAYNKQITGRKTVRDMQQRPVGVNGPATLQLPPMSLDELSRLKELLSDHGIEEGHVEREDGGLSFEEIRKKIEEAVEFTKEQEKEKYEAEVSNLKAQLEEKKTQSNEKDKVIKNLSKNYNQNIEELKNKVDNISSRISAGKAFVSDDDEDRPKIKDDVFIDPLDKDHEPELDPHIKEASKTSVDRNIIKDLAKLKGLLNKEKK